MMYYDTSSLGFVKTTLKSVEHEENFADGLSRPCPHRRIGHTVLIVVKHEFNGDLSKHRMHAGEDHPVSTSAKLLPSLF